MRFYWKKAIWPRQETFIHLLSCKCASKAVALMNLQPEWEWKTGVLKTDIVQQHKNKTFQRSVGELPPPTETSGHRFIPGFLSVASLFYLSLPNAAAQIKTSAGREADVLHSGAGEEPIRLMQGAPFWPWGDCKLAQKGSFPPGRERMQLYCWLETSHQRQPVQLWFLCQVLRRMCWSHQAHIPWNVSWDASTGQRTEIK